MTAPRILIASPTYDGAVQVEYLRAILRLTEAFRERGIGCELFCERATQLHVMRSVMASKALDEGYSHVLFADCDIGFAPSAVLRLLAADKPVIGAAYPYRTLPGQAEATAAGESVQQLVATNVPYAVWFAPGTQQIDVRDGVCAAAAVGTGLLLVRRDALEAMVTQGVAPRFANGFPHTQWHAAPHYHGFFIHLLHEGGFLSEDLSFCRRWQACGGTVHALCDEAILHIGPVPIVGRYFDKLSAGRI